MTVICTTMDSSFIEIRKLLIRIFDCQNAFHLNQKDGSQQSAQTSATLINLKCYSSLVSKLSIMALCLDNMATNDTQIACFTGRLGVIALSIIFDM